MQIMLAAFAVIAFVIGYGLGSFQVMLLVYAGGVVLTTLITVPNWPFFNRNPLKWLDPSEAEKHPKPQYASSTSKKKAAKKGFEIMECKVLLYGATVLMPVAWELGEEEVIVDEQVVNLDEQSMPTITLLLKLKFGNIHRDGRPMGFSLPLLTSIAKFISDGGFFALESW
ncbi:hypothetical protein RJ639_041387 [Escallonia herrerae]|uniref:Signal peptidase complex subunit 1 n=1 Tax=Escallonia herrerae TaxID=1293975 RepID=A0AA89B7R2_9ASTE|nr:hypothetical protein RJ639_041387 [Escallonia herrerae]